MKIKFRETQAGLKIDNRNKLDDKYAYRTKMGA